MPLPLLRAGALALAAVLLAGCGGDKPTYVNPTSGPLPTSASAKELATTVSPGCAWTVLSAAQTGSAETDQTLFCAAEYLFLTLSVQSTADTVEGIEKGMAQSDGYFCEWWGVADVMYPLLQEKGAIPKTLNGSDAPTSAGGVVMGGNWTIITPDVATADRVAATTHGYLLTAPEDCPSPS